MKAVNLFSSAGIGELGIREVGIETIVANELLEERADLYTINYPKTKMIVGDIWEKKTEIIEESKSKLDSDEDLFLVNATPPCQGMSLTGMGKMLNDFRSGKNPKLNPKFDERNRLIIPTIEIINALQPKWVIIENVENMKNTLIYDDKNNLISIPDYIFTHTPGYVGKSETINVADYGVPQYRKRLITILTRDEKGKEFFKRKNSFLPNTTHSEKPDIFHEPWVTLREAIGNLPPLDSRKGKEKNITFSPLHIVPVLDEKKYFWISHTPEGRSAFDNQCINVHCMFQGNQNHGSKRDTRSGITTALKTTPLYCEKCGEMLPRPYVEKNGTFRLMKGYISAYKRMWWDKPASTLTTRFQFVSSDNNVHPSQNRVLSLYEGTVIQTISKYDYKWHNAKLGLIRDAIGESIPPLITELIGNNILNIT